MNKKIIEMLPKVELHCHLDGSVPIDTLKKFASEMGIDSNEIDKVIAPAKSLDLKDYLESFNIILPLLQTTKNLTEATYQTIKNISADNVRYIELRFAPLLHTQQGLNVKEVFEAVILGVEAATQEFPIIVNLLVCAMRNHSEDNNLSLVDQVKDVNNKYIVGFDFAGNEEVDANKHISDVIQSVKEAKLHITLHSGECNCPHNVLDAVLLGAERIGHGVAIRNDKEIMQLCREKKILLELAPTSNIQTNAISSWGDYPLRLFMQNSIDCCINTDNRTVSNTSLSNEYYLLAEKCDLTYEEMMELNLNAIAHAFTTNKVKETIIREIETSFKNLIH